MEQDPGWAFFQGLTPLAALARLDQEGSFPSSNAEIVPFPFIKEGYALVLQENSLRKVGPSEAVTTGS